MTDIFTITRVFHAPRARVWRAWTDPAQFVKWFGPRDFTCEVKTFDVRPGGSVHSRLTMPGGVEMWGRFVFREVEEQRKLVWEHYLRR